MASDGYRPPGTQKPRRVGRRLHYELLVCGLEGHELVGTDAAELRPEDAVYAREEGQVRWYRCLRCDSWLPLARPAAPRVRYPPERRELELPPRGKALRDRVVLRLIAIDRAVHCLALAVLAVALLLVAAHELQLRRVVFRVVNAIHGMSSGPAHGGHGGVLRSLEHVLTLRSSTLYAVAAIAAAYSALEGAEAVGLWLQKRWAEYLTFVATVLLLPYELYELARGVSPFKVVALAINVLVAVYLLLAKRLFGLRGGAAAERAEREREAGWEELERTAPPLPAEAEAPA
jgi:uncharacterized membrane protein (DUF2068 family)